MKHATLKNTMIVLALGFSSLAAQATEFAITSMDVTAARVNAAFMPPEGNALNPTDTTNLVGGYINGEDAITVTPLGAMGADQILYTAETNQNPNGMGPAAGSFSGGPAPTGYVDMAAKTITVDMTSLFANHGGMDQSVGGIATGSYDALTGAYNMSVTATLTQGGHAGDDVTFTFSGTAKLDIESRANEASCDAYKGAAFGMCAAYCGAMECDSDASVKACGRIKDSFMVMTGEEAMPCDDGAE